MSAYDDGLALSMTRLALSRDLDGLDIVRAIAVDDVVKGRVDDPRPYLRAVEAAISSRSHELLHP